jgi:hypothetical protein
MVIGGGVVVRRSSVWGVGWSEEGVVRGHVMGWSWSLGMCEGACGVGDGVGCQGVREWVWALGWWCLGMRSMGWGWSVMVPGGHHWGWLSLGEGVGC